MFGHASQRGDTNRHENPVGPLRQDQLGLHGQACQEAASPGSHVRPQEGAQIVRRRTQPGRQRPAFHCSNLVEHIDRSAENRLIAQAHQEIVLYDPALLVLKVNELANKILTSKQCVFYTGAGISTSGKAESTTLYRILKFDFPSKLIRQKYFL